MSQVANFNGKNYIEPGVYAANAYNPVSVTNVANFGNAMIIDTGLSINGSYEFAGGSGVKGELYSGIKSVYEFNNYNDFYNFMGGGPVADIAKNLFSPAMGASGIPKLYYVRAATTASAKIVLTMSSGNTLTLTCKNEGVAGNGQAVSTVLKAGYAAKIVAGLTAGKFKLLIYKGNFEGVDDAGEAYGSYSLDNASGNLIVESSELGTLQELYNWCISNKQFLAHFNASMAGTGSTALVAISQTLATGGTTTFLNGTEFDDVLDAITELDVSFFLTTKYGTTNGTDAATNGKLFTFLKQSAKFTEFMVIGGGTSSSDLIGASNTSQAIAKYFNSEQVEVVHGSPVVTRKDGNGTKALPSIYLAASVIGLVAGGSPQTPLTFKRIGYDSFVYDLKKSEREAALQAGIMHVRNISGYWCINQGITSLQDNKNTIAPDGQSFEFSIALIKAQINKELIIEGENRFVGKTTAQSSPSSVKTFTETKLQSFVAYKGNDNLILDWKNVVVSAKNGDQYISYEFIPNVPVNKQFFIGNILDYKF